MYNVILLLGEAGTGKDTICKELCNFRPNMFHRVVPHTTRPKRDGEEEGYDYYFIDDKDWNSYHFIKETQFNNWHYGTSFESLKENMINVAVVNPVEGIAFLENKNINVLKKIKLKTSDKIRLKRQLERESNPDVAEICRRFIADENDFTLYNFVADTRNNYCENDLWKIIKEISNFVDDCIMQGKIR